MFYLWITLMVASMNFPPVRATAGLDNNSDDKTIHIEEADNRTESEKLEQHSHTQSAEADNGDAHGGQKQGNQSVETGNGDTHGRQNQHNPIEEQDSSKTTVLKTGAEFVGALASSMAKGVTTIVHHVGRGIYNVANWSKQKIGEYWSKGEKIDESIDNKQIYEKDESTNDAHHHTTNFNPLLNSTVNP